MTALHQRTFALLLLLISFHTLAAQTFTRKESNFNTGWKFMLADDAKAKNSQHPDHSWMDVDLPHDWSIEQPFDKNSPSGGEGAFLPGGIGWYRKHFKISDSLIQKRVYIKFGGVYMNSQVWINGKFLGTRPYGYTSFEYDLTGYLNFGSDKTNVISVRVDNSAQINSRWYSGSGIYRNVSLLIHEQTHFGHTGGIFIKTPEINSGEALSRILYEVQSNAFSGSSPAWWDKKNLRKRIKEDIQIKSSIFGNDGSIVSTHELNDSITDFSKKNFIADLKISNPRLWSSETPVLYRLVSLIYVDGRKTDSVSTYFGIRKLEYSANDGLKVNGTITKLKGVCLHAEAGALGMAVPLSTWEYRLKKLKDMGCNAIRPSHHPFAPEFYDLCDSMGFYVMDEAFDEWGTGYVWGRTENPSGKKSFGYHQYFDQWSETDLKAMILRDRNHPSIIMYSVGNEVPDQRTAEGTEQLKRLMKICHQTDDTRPVTTACDWFMDANQNGFLASSDIAGYNYIDNVYKDTMYTVEKAKYPNRLFLGTETYHDVRNFLAYRDNPYVIGEFLWVGYDYLGESSSWPKKGWDAGLIDISSHERSEYYLRKSYWSTSPVVYIGVDANEKLPNQWYPRNLIRSWNSNEPGVSLPVYIYSNCDRIELFLNGKKMGSYPVNKNLYYVQAPVKYHPGEIKAIGYKNGKKVTEDILKTAGDPADINLHTVQSKFLQNGNNITFVEITVIDNKGVMVPAAAIPLEVQLSGPGKLLAFDSGDLKTDELLKSNHRKTWNGKALLTISHKDKVTIMVSGTGMSKTISLAGYNAIEPIPF